MWQEIESENNEAGTEEKTNHHSWAQRKLSPLSLLNPLNILLSINGPLLSLGFNRLND